MIGQYLSQTNESATVPSLQFFLELNKALVCIIFKTLYHIESYGTCMMH